MSKYGDIWAEINEAFKSDWWFVDRNLGFDLGAQKVKAVMWTSTYMYLHVCNQLKTTKNIFHQWMLLSALLLMFAQNHFLTSTNVEGTYFLYGKKLLVSRVTRLGEFSPKWAIVYIPTMGSF
jgi:hypothetical protein